MSNPADIRTLVFTFPAPAGQVIVKGLGVKAKEFVVSEVNYEKGKVFTAKMQSELSYIRPEATIDEQRLVNTINQLNVSKSKLDKITTDSKVNLVSIA